MAKQTDKLYEVKAVVHVVVGAHGENKAPTEAKTELNGLSENLRAIEIGEVRDYGAATGASMDVIGTSKVLYIVRALVAITLYARNDAAAKKSAKAKLEELKLQNVTIASWHIQQ